MNQSAGPKPSCLSRPHRTIEPADHDPCRIRLLGPLVRTAPRERGRRTSRWSGAAARRAVPRAPARRLKRGSSAFNTGAWRGVRSPVLRHWRGFREAGRAWRSCPVHTNPAPDAGRATVKTPVASRGVDPLLIAAAGGGQAEVSPRPAPDKLCHQAWRPSSPTLLVTIVPFMRAHGSWRNP